MHDKILSELGLTNSESKIYMELLGLGTAGIGQIMEKTGMHRRNIYDSIGRLVEKGLVSSVIVNNKKVFSPASPKRLIGLVEERKFRLDNLKERLNKIMPELDLRTKFEEGHDVRFFRGVEGLKTVFDHILRTGKGYIGVSPGYQLENMFKHYIRHFASKRAKAKIKNRLIYSEKARKGLKKHPLSKIRYIP